MSKPNENFTLSVNDLANIENALRVYSGLVDKNKKLEIQNLLGKLHNEKHWYRPSNEIYVSG